MKVVGDTIWFPAAEFPIPREISFIMEWHSNRNSLSWVSAHKSLTNPSLSIHPSFSHSSCALHTPLAPVLAGLGSSCPLWDSFSVSGWVVAAFIWVAASAENHSWHCSQGPLHETEQKFRRSSAVLGGSLQLVTEDSKNFNYSC